MLRRCILVSQTSHAASEIPANNFLVSLSTTCLFGFKVSQSSVLVGITTDINFSCQRRQCAEKRNNESSQHCLPHTLRRYLCRSHAGRRPLHTLVHRQLRSYVYWRRSPLDSPARLGRSEVAWLPIYIRHWCGIWV